MLEHDRRSERIHVCVNPGERQLVEQVARQLGVTLSTFGKSAILSAAVGLSKEVLDGRPGDSPR